MTSSATRAPTSPLCSPSRRTARPRRRPASTSQSGNPGGRPKASARVRDAARLHTDTALGVLLEIAKGGTSEAARVAAANALLDRGYGKPTTVLDGDGEGGPIQTSLRVSFIRPAAIAAEAGDDAEGGA